MVVRVFRNILAKKSVLPSMSKPRRNFYLVCLDYTLICMSLSVGLSVCVIKSVCSAQAKIIHTHPLNGLCLGLPRSAATRKVKPIWILLKQETVSGSGISWAICKSAPRTMTRTVHDAYRIMTTFEVYQTTNHIDCCQK